MAFTPKKVIVPPKIICQRCNDMGYVVGTMRTGNNPLIIKEWKERCPFCMPTNKYGNLQHKIQQAETLQLEHKPPRDKDDEDNWGSDGGNNLP